jgi:hypothetical protein
MFRRIFVGAAVVATFASGSADLSACGDKFLRAGRSQRSRGYAAIHPASILIYKPTATPKGLKEFQALLKRAGHKSVTVQNAGGLSQAFATAKYDVVIADYADAANIKVELQSIPSKPGYLPVLSNPTKAMAADASREYVCLIRPDAMTKYDALAQIDHLMEQRLKETTAAAASR